MLGLEPARVAELLRDVPATEERVRARLAKQGGLGYETPSVATFPALDDFIAWVRACAALPMLAWLDGTSAGEAQPEPLLECVRAKGTVAVNIIPERNWNLRDPAARALKTARLHEFVTAAERLDLPLNIGTEMNRDGQPFADDLDKPALKPYAEIFVTSPRCVDGGDVDLLHRHHRREGTICLSATSRKPIG